MGVCLSPKNIDIQFTTVNVNTQSNELPTMYVHVYIYILYVIMFI